MVQWTTPLRKLLIFFALIFSAAIISAQNEGFKKGQWLGEKAHYGRPPYVKKGNEMELPKSKASESEGRFLWTDQNRKKVSETWGIGVTISNRNNDFTTCNHTTITEYQKFSVLGSLVRSLTNIDKIPANIVCHFTESAQLGPGAIAPESPFGLPRLYQTRSSSHASYFLYNSTATGFDTGSILLSDAHSLERIIYEQRPDTFLEEVKADFIKIRNRQPKSDVNDINYDQSNVKGDFRLVFMGNIRPGAFKSNAFNFFLRTSNRPLYLQFDLANPETALEVLDKNVFEPILEKRSARDKDDRWKKLPDGEYYLPAWVPQRPGAWIGPSISSPFYNKFSIKCSHEDNKWLKQYSLKWLGNDALLKRIPLFFNCIETKRDVNYYEDWYTNEERGMLKNVSIPEDEKVTYPPTSPTTDPPTVRPQPGPVTESASGGNEWIYILIALIVVLLIAAAGVYYFMYYRAGPDAPASPTSRVASATSGIRRSSLSSPGAKSRSRSKLSGQATARSGIPSSGMASQKVGSRSGKRSSMIGSPSSVTGKSRSVSGSRSNAPRSNVAASTASRKI